METTQDLIDAAYSRIVTEVVALAVGAVQEDINIGK
jgi:hypothetical protein